MRLVLDGIEDRSYKPAHIVRLYGGVPEVIMHPIKHGVYWRHKIDITMVSTMQVSYNGYYPSPPSW